MNNGTNKPKMSAAEREGRKHIRRLNDVLHKRIFSSKERFDEAVDNELKGKPFEFFTTPEGLTLPAAPFIKEIARPDKHGSYYPHFLEHVATL